MSIDPNIFREYDIRGIVGEQLTRETVAVLGKALGTYFQKNSARRIAIGYDARASSPEFCSILTGQLNQAGCDVVLIGMVPTPVLYHTVFTKPVDGGVMITGSHNPPDHNGFKICLGKSTLFGPQIQEIRAIATQAETRAVAKQAETRAVASVRDVGRGNPETIEVLAEYCRDIVSRVDLGSLEAKTENHPVRRSGVHPSFVRRGVLKVVIDCGNGMAGVTAVPVYRELGVELIELFTEPDSNFPNHHPDPTVEENLHDLIAAVKENEADLGIAFDGDGDRIGVVDETGRIIRGDELTILFARSILAEHPGATVIGEVKCSQNLFDDIEKHGGKPLMWKAGHSLIKAKMKETGAVLAGEMSGHIFFADRFYGFDDATYAGARLLEILSKTDKPLSALLADLPRKFSTPEIRIPCPESRKFDVVRRIAEHFTALGHDVNITDGARITFDHGWGIVRSSNTHAGLILRFEARSEKSLVEIKITVESQVRAFIRS